MIDEISGRCRRRWRGCCGSAGHSAGRGAPDEMAASEFHHPGDKIEALKKSRRELAGQKKALYAEYREAQRQMREAVTIKANIDHLLGITDERENKAQER